jgi:hypothetical protein
MIRQPIEIDTSELVNDIKIISSSGKNQYQLKYEESNDKFNIWYETGSGEFKVKKISMTKCIKLNKETFITFGLLQAEGTKSLKYTNFQFSNSDSSLVRMVLNYFVSVWKIPKSYFSVEIYYWRKDFSEKKKFLENFWRKALNIKKITVREGTKYRLSEKAKKFGVASLRINNKAISGVILNFLYKVIQPLVEKNQIYVGWYLIGLFEGDGILINKSLGNVGLSFNPSNSEFNHYQKILKLIGIEVDKERVIKKYKKYIPFINWKEQGILLDATEGYLFLDERNNIFISNFLRNQYVKSLSRLEKLQYFCINTKNYSKTFNCVTRSALNSLHRLEDLGLLYRDTNKKPFEFRITYDGYIFLEFINKLKLIGE